MNIVRQLVLLALALLPVACTGIDSKHEAAPELAALRTMGYRIAVIPFAVSAPADGFLTDSLGSVGELISLEASRAVPMRERLGNVLHDDVVAWLQQTEFDVIDPWHVRTQLGHTGLLDAALDPGRVADVARAVGADGIVYGDVRRWNRDYYVLQSTADVALHLELIDANTGKRLFVTDRSEQVGSGITGGPTGYVSAATEPIAGLRGSNLRTLTRSVARNAVADLNGGELGNQSGPMTPRLAVVALAKDHAGPFQVGERVDVIAVGSPDCDVRFDIGCLRTAVPMRQTAVQDDPRGPRATYLGHYIVAAGDRAEELPLLCTIQRGAARRTVAVRYRWEGTVALLGKTE